MERGFQRVSERDGADVFSSWWRPARREVATRLAQKTISVKKKKIDSETLECLTWVKIE